jgi:hypothetical protein
MRDVEGAGGREIPEGAAMRANKGCGRASAPHCIISPAGGGPRRCASAGRLLQARPRPPPAPEVSAETSGDRLAPPPPLLVAAPGRLPSKLTLLTPAPAPARSIAHVPFVTKPATILCTQTGP